MSGPFLGLFYPYSPEYGPILLKYSLEVVFKQAKTVFEEPLKNSNFYGNRTDPMFALLVQL